MKSSRYDPSSRTWSVALHEYSSFIERLSGNDDINVIPLPAWILATFQEKEVSASSGIDLRPIDEKLVSRLMPFQREGVEFGIKNQGRVLIADDMGLGKTIQAIAIASYYHREWPLLVVCPSSVRMMWADELTRWLPFLKLKDICVVFNTKAELSSRLITIVSYDLAVRLKDQLKAMNFQVVIADECHSLKNHKAARSKVCLPLLKTSKRAILLSGTPALSRPSELYTQVDAVAPQLFPSFIQFGVRYCNGHQGHFGWDFSGASNLEELQLLLEEKLMIRRLKSDVLAQLPEKFRQVVKLDPNLVKTTGLKQAEKAFERAASLKGSQKHSALLNFFSETAVVKCPAVIDYVSELMENGVKVLIFAHHKVVMNALCDSLASNRHQYIRIDGLTAGEDRLSLCNEFQSDPSVLAAVLSVTAANTGINLTSANIVVFTELYWNPGVLIQAEDRVYRIGQKNSVNIRYLVASGTADDYMWPLLQQKLSVLGKAGLSKDDFAQSDRQLHQDSRQERIFHYFEELVSNEQQALLSVEVKDGLLNKREEWGDEICEPDIKRPRLQ
jgi:SWI/SNF-related matrix-associated actin-dependent regulator 1 of chromatin subfamily A